MNLLNWFTAPRYDIKCFRFVGLSLSETPCSLLFTGATPFCDNLYSTHSKSVAAKLHLPNFKLTFASSSLFSTSSTFWICSSSVPWVTIKMSSMNAKVFEIPASVQSIIRWNSVGIDVSP